jgi:FkbM family methyltransferase
VKITLAKVFSMLNAVTLNLPYSAVRQAFNFASGKRKDLWLKSPLRYLVSPVKLPDGNHVFWSWEEDAFWLKDMIKEIYQEQAYESFFHAEEDDVIVDVGANIGLFTLKASKKVGKKGKVIAFEPGKRNFALLSRNIRINRCQNVIPLHVAVSDYNGKGTLYLKDVCLQNTLSSCVNQETATVGTPVIEVRRLSTVLEKLKIRRVDMLKIDAEGCEFEVLKGSQEFLENHGIRKISIAAYHSQEEPKILKAYLHKFGYHVFFKRNIGLADFKRIHVFGISPLEGKFQ